MGKCLRRQEEIKKNLNRNLKYACEKDKLWRKVLERNGDLVSLDLNVQLVNELFFE